MHRFAFTDARTIAEAARGASTTVADAMINSLTDHETSVVKAGGIDLLDLLKENLLTPAKVVNLKQIPGLDAVTDEGDGELRIGPMVTLASLAAEPRLQQRYPALADALRSSASPQIRNVATIGGNLLQRPRCWYFRSHAYHCLRKGGGHCFAIAGENQYHAIFKNMPCAIVHPSTVATVLVALGAIVELTTAAATTRQLALENFFVAPERDLQRENDLQAQEILTAIRLPKPLPGTRMVHVRQTERAAFDWPLADVAVVLVLDPDGTCRRAGIILGAAAPVPYRAEKAEILLTGHRIDESVAAQAGRAALAGATPLSKNGYKLPLFEALIRRAILAAAAPP